jgi:hypothetical protein
VGERFWIYRAGDGEDATTGSRRWILHGIFRMSASCYVKLRLQPFHDLHSHAFHHRVLDRVAEAGNGAVDRDKMALGCFGAVDTKPAQ